MQILSPAKINIGLHITSKRPDGYHNLETIFYPIPLYDTLEVKIIDSPQCPYCFTSHGISIPGASEKNLVIIYILDIDPKYALEDSAAFITGYDPQTGKGGIRVKLTLKGSNKWLNY